MSKGKRFGKGRTRFGGGNTRRRTKGSTRGALGRSPSLGRSLNIEPLEERRLLAVFPVLNLFDLQDDGEGELEVVPGSLRAAINQANLTAGPDAIVFDEAAFLFGGLFGENEIILQNSEQVGGQLEITNPLQIFGPGPRRLTVRAAPGQRIFNVNVDETVPVTIGGLTITGGTASGGRGGAIFNAGNLTIVESVVSDSFATDGGGGIFLSKGSLTVNRSLISGNTTLGNGGGIYSGLDGEAPNTYIHNSTLAGNSTGFYGYGGGLFNRQGKTSIYNSTITGNTAYYGGGVGSWGNPIIEGGGGGDPPVVFTNFGHSIFTDNYSDDIATVGLEDPDAEEPVPLDPSTTTKGYNIVTFPGGGVTLFEDIDQSGIAPMDILLDDGFGSLLLADFGGSTDVYLPVAGGAAIDAGNPSIFPNPLDFEQRGRHFTRIFNNVIDIGAAEAQAGNFVVDMLTDGTNDQFSEIFTKETFFGATFYLVNFDPYTSVGDFSIREALDFSEKNPDVDNILFSDTLQIEEDTDPFTSAPTLTLEFGELLVSESVNVVGPTTFELEINANADGSRAITVDDGVESTFIDVTISDLTLVNADGVIDGGAILSKENLILLRDIVKSNSVAFRGGGLFAELGTLVVDGSTFHDNFASNQGGGLFVHDSVPSATITNSTFSGNFAAVNGGGLFNAGPDTTLEYSTLTLNDAGSFKGSGVLNDPNTGVLHVLSTIISGNGDIINNDIDYGSEPAAGIISDGYNLIGLGNAVGAFTGPGDQTLVLDPKLAPLEFTGGPTPTHRVLENSPALDAGDPNAVAGVGGVPDYDQRGGSSVRVFDGNLSGTAQIDIGAYELQESVYTVDSLFDENDGDYSPGNFSLREAIEVANVTVNPLPELINFDSFLFGFGTATIFLNDFGLQPGTSPDLQITDTVSILGPGHLTLAIDGSGLLGGEPLFTVDDGNAAAAIDVTFEGLRLQNNVGRAFVSQENLTVDGLFFVGNTGGGLAQVGETLTVSNITMTGNSGASGGGLSIDSGVLDLSSSIFTGNETVGVGSKGGAVFIDNSTATLNQVIISGNDAPGGSTVGGGIYVGNSTVELNNSVLTGNTTTGSQSVGGGLAAEQSDITLNGTIVAANTTDGTNSEGGGIHTSGGSLTLIASSILKNSTSGNTSPGGGIAAVGSELSVTQTTVGQNTTSGDDADGGGIYQLGGNLTVRDSTISANIISGNDSQGGGVFSSTDLSGTSTTRILNSTLSGNAATGDAAGANKGLSRGGGIYNAAGLTEILHSTITDNHTPYQGQGGGVASYGNPSTTRTEVLSTIISGNSANDAGVADTWTDVDYVVGNFSNSFLSLGYNLVGTGLALNGGGFSESGDQTGVNDPMLGPLTNNGGLTSTHAILDGSAAIDTGDPGFDPNDSTPPLTTDQRGVARVQHGQIDVGAVESPFAPGIAEDFNSDGNVNGFDFLLWQRGFGTGPGATKLDGDANLDGFVDDQDLGQWEEVFGTTAATEAVASSAASSTASSAAFSSGLVVSSSPALTAALVVESPAASYEISTVESFVSPSLATKPPVSSPGASALQDTAAATPRFTITGVNSSERSQQAKFNPGLLRGLHEKMARSSLRPALSHDHRVFGDRVFGDRVFGDRVFGDRGGITADRLQGESVRQHVLDRLFADDRSDEFGRDRHFSADGLAIGRRLAEEQAAHEADESSESPLVEDLVFAIIGA
ncbi:MAG: choice-of-anchor Q domain-containing protein [Pirellulales bacterium]